MLYISLSVYIICFPFFNVIDSIFTLLLGNVKRKQVEYYQFVYYLLYIFCCVCIDDIVRPVVVGIDSIVISSYLL